MAARGSLHAILEIYQPAHTYKPREIRDDFDDWTLGWSE